MLTYLSIVVLLLISRCDGVWKCMTSKPSQLDTKSEDNETLPLSIFDNVKETDPAWANVREYNGKPDPERRVSAAESIKFYLFTLEYSLGIKIDKNVEQIKDRGWKLGRDYELKVLIHGFHQHIKTDMPQVIARAYRQSGIKANIMAVDWGALAKGWNYFNAAGQVFEVSKVVGPYLEFLVKNRLTSYSKIHLIGHGLGAQVAGFVGNYTRSLHHKNVSRITGLDPSGPGFGPGSYKLDPSDATFVDVIHTNMGDEVPKGNVAFGTRLKSGHADFLPNGGFIQPGCRNVNPVGTVVLETCSHKKAVTYFATSISKKNAYQACKCPSWAYFIRRRCTCYEKTVMGEFCSTKARGEYFLS